jgi:hypothetical protein
MIVFACYIVVKLSNFAESFFGGGGGDGGQLRPSISACRSEIRRCAVLNASALLKPCALLNESVVLRDSALNRPLGFVKSSAFDKAFGFALPFGVVKDER